MRARLSFATMDRLPAAVVQPGYDPTRLGTGIVHLGVGAFHRAHAALYTDAAIAGAGGDWGIVGVSLRRPDAATALVPQDGLFTVELRDAVPELRLCGALRRVLTAPEDPAAVTAAIAAAATHVVTLTVTEKGYALGPDSGLDPANPDVAHDLAQPDATPRSTLGWLAAGLAARRRGSAAPLTIVSCDNLSDNGAKLRAALLDLLDRVDPALARWTEREVAFPATMVDSIAPAMVKADYEARADRLGLTDLGAVQRERYAAWVIEDRFAGPRPAWEHGGAEFVASVEQAERLKLRVLNAGHSALAYLGLARGHALVREAVADPAVLGPVDAMIGEVAESLPCLPVGEYWRKTKARFANPAMDHRLAQIAEDGSAKLRERILPSLAANLAAGRPAEHLLASVRAWIGHVRAAPVRDPAEPALARWRAAGSADRALVVLLGWEVACPGLGDALRDEAITGARPGRT